MTYSTGMADPEIVGAQPAAATARTPASQVDTAEPRAGFEVHLDVFEGPFDLLLGLIAKHELDITAVSLSTVTDEFIAFIRAMGAVWDLDRASEFLVIAATLVDLKAARLLPAAEVEDEDDLALLEARDLLFARLLQYRAYKEVAAILVRMFAAESRRYPRSVGPEPRFGLYPDSADCRAVEPVADPGPCWACAGTCVTVGGSDCGACGGTGIE